MKQLILVILLLTVNGLACLGQSTKDDNAPTRVDNVRTRVDPSTFELVVTYDLINLRPGDSLAVRFLADKKRLKAKSVTGDVGYDIEPGHDRQIRWNFIKDGITGKANLEAEVFGVKPGIFGGKNSTLKVATLIGAVGAGVYSAVLGAKITSDVRSYNNSPEPISLQEDQALADQKSSINRNKTIFYSAVGLSAALLLTDIFLISRPRKPSNIKFSTTAPMGVPSLTFTRLIR